MAAKPRREVAKNGPSRFTLAANQLILAELRGMNSRCRPCRSHGESTAQSFRSPLPMGRWQFHGECDSRPRRVAATVRERNEPGRPGSSPSPTTSTQFRGNRSAWPRCPQVHKTRSSPLGMCARAKGSLASNNAWSRTVCPAVRSSRRRRRPHGAVAAAGVAMGLYGGIFDSGDHVGSGGDAPGGGEGSFVGARPWAEADRAIAFEPLAAAQGDGGASPFGDDGLNHITLGMEKGSEARGVHFEASPSTNRAVRRINRDISPRSAYFTASANREGPNKPSSHRRWNKPDRTHFWKRSWAVELGQSPVSFKAFHWLPVLST